MKKHYSFERVRGIFNYPSASKWRRSGGDRRTGAEGHRSMETGAVASVETDRREKKDRRTNWLDVVSKIIHPKASEDIDIWTWH